MSKFEKTREVIEAFKKELPNLESFGELNMELLVCEEALAELDAAEKKIEELEKYEWQYKELCK